ncbi:RNA 2',3'-cyclic phosphodiesterase [Candidatus Woesearchaeota archaeon]|nr:RNA 2',3'-cyclic phosphodiesterase [Candidatus Woesearchaeota archaeon]
MRLFVAIEFSGLKKELEGIQNKIDDKLAKLKKTESFHITLKFLGKVPEERAEEAKKRLKKVSFRPFKLKLDKIGVFPSEDYIRVIWVGVKPSEEVMRLQEGVETALKDLKIKKDFEFKPHITLARVKSVTEKEELIGSLKKIDVKGKAIDIRDFRLVKSRLTPKGPVYEDVAVFSV